MSARQQGQKPKAAVPPGEAGRGGRGNVPCRRIGYIPELDGIRGVALLIVLISHTSVLYPAGRWLAVPGGYLALDMFFVLSGFLITSLLLREQAETGVISCRTFYRRRVLRLFPALAVLLVAHWCYSASVQQPPELERATLLSVALYYANWKIAAGQDFVLGLKHLWSLSVEEQFYVIWPIVIAVILPLRRSLSFVVGSVAIAVICVAVQRALLWQSGLPWYRIYVRTDAHAEGLLLGALLAHLWVRGKTPARFTRSAAWAASAFLAYCLFFVPPQQASLYLGVFTVIALCWAIIILAMVETDWSLNPLLRSRVLRIVGRVSYACYLWHLPVYVAVARHTPKWPPLGRIAVAIAMTTLATILSWTLVERRFLAWKGRPGEAIPVGRSSI